MPELSGFIKIEDTKITGIVSELPVFVSRTNPHNQIVLRKDLVTNEWFCTQSMSLSLTNDLNTVKFWNKVLVVMINLVSSDLTTGILQVTLEG